MKRRSVLSHPMSILTKNKLIRLGQYLVDKVDRPANFETFKGSSCYTLVAEFLKDKQSSSGSKLWALRYSANNPGSIDHVLVTDAEDKVICDLYNGEFLNGQYVPKYMKTPSGNKTLDLGPGDMAVTCKISLGALRELYMREAKSGTETSKRKLIATLTTKAATKTSELDMFLTDGAEHYLTRSSSLSDYLVSLAGWIRDDTPKFAEVLKKAAQKFQVPNKVHATMYNWTSLKGEKWYKAIMNSDLGSFKDKEKIWIKINTEKPLKLGKTVWIYGPKSGNVMHVIWDTLGEFVKIYLEEGKPVPATPREQKILDAAWEPVIEKIVKGWKKSQKLADRLLNRK